MNNALPVSLGDRFISKVDVRHPAECWEWTAGRDSDGYGIFWLDGRSRRATRLLIEAVVGEIKPEDFALHRCDNPPCMNPAHIFVGTNLDNIRDRTRKGRTARQFGEANGMSSSKRKERVTCPSPQSPSRMG